MRLLFCCLIIGVFIAGLWAGPMVLLRYVLFENQFTDAFKWISCWSIALNGFTLFINIVDKILACCKTEEKRVPECVLLFFTLLGGGTGTALSMIFVNHKSSKETYQRAFIVTAIFSIFFIAGAYGLAYGLDASKPDPTTTPTFTSSNFFRTAVATTTT